MRQAYHIFGHGHFGEITLLLIFGQNINMNMRDICSRRIKRPSETNMDDFAFELTSFLQKATDSLQNGKGDIHKVPRLRTKVVDGFRGLGRNCSKARNTKTVRTPTEKSGWGTLP